MTMLAGRYEVGAVLGRGGMGEVRAGSDRRLGRAVAVKILRPDLAGRADVRRRFDVESRAAGRLVHPNVVTVLDYGVDAGVPFLVMERLPGRTLNDEIARGPLSCTRALEVAHDVLAALDAAHRSGVVHRDVKPGNVLLADDGRAKVADFGIAKIMEADEATATHELIATLAYVAPERPPGKAASPRSDVASTGVLLYEALTGTKPFPATSAAEQIRAIERGAHVPLQVQREDVPAEVADAVERAIARDPAQRFPSAAAMAAALHL